MNLKGNPFYRLGATPFDNRSVVEGLVNAHATEENVSSWRQLSSELFVPKSRLRAELSWLPGMSRSQLIRPSQFLDLPLPSQSEFDELPPLARCNLLAHQLQGAPHDATKELTDNILSMAQALNDVEPERVLEDLNRARKECGMSILAKIGDVEDELKRHSSDLFEAQKAALNLLRPRALIHSLTKVAEASTDSGHKRGLELIYQLVDDYERCIKQYTDRESQFIDTLLMQLDQAMEGGANNTVSSIAQDVEHRLNSWQVIMRPILLCKRPRGYKHYATESLKDLLLSRRNSSSSSGQFSAVNGRLITAFTEGAIRGLFLDDSLTGYDIGYGAIAKLARVPQPPLRVQPETRSNAPFVAIAPARWSQPPVPSLPQNSKSTTIPLLVGVVMVVGVVGICLLATLTSGPGRGTNPTNAQAKQIAIENATNIAHNTTVEAIIRSNNRVAALNEAATAQASKNPASRFDARGQEYIRLLIQRGNALNAAIKRLELLHAQLYSDPSRYGYDDDWRRQLEESLVDLETIATRLEELNSPGGSDFFQASQRIREGATLIRQSTQRARSAVQQGSKELFDQALSDAFTAGQTVYSGYKILVPQ